MSDADNEEANSPVASLPAGIVPVPPVVILTDDHEVCDEQRRTVQAEWPRLIEPVLLVTPMSDRELEPVSDRDWLIDYLARMLPGTHSLRRERIAEGILERFGVHDTETTAF